MHLFIAICRHREVGFAITVGSELWQCHLCRPSVWNRRYFAECVRAWSLKEQNYTVAWGTSFTSFACLYINSLKMYNTHNDIDDDLFSPLGKLAGRAIYFACVNFFFFSLFFDYEQSYLSIYWTDFHDFFSPNGRYLHEFSWSNPFFLISQRTLPWQPIFCCTGLDRSEPKYLRIHWTDFHNLCTRGIYRGGSGRSLRPIWLRGKNSPPLGGRIPPLTVHDVSVVLIIFRICTTIVGSSASRGLV